MDSCFLNLTSHSNYGRYLSLRPTPPLTVPLNIKYPPSSNTLLVIHPWRRPSAVAMKNAGNVSGRQHHRVLRPQKHPLHAPVPPRTSKWTWFAGIFCAIFWIFVILGGLAVLIIYLVFRPKNPHFDIASATLNAAYLDTGTLLNADLTVLANFTNPNKKIGLAFNYVEVDLYYMKTLVATRAVEAFYQGSRETTLADIQLVSSQVLLPSGDAQRLRRQLETNSVMFEVKGFFRTRSDYGNLFHFSNWMHAECTILLRGSPGGVLAGKRCNTKRA